MAKLYKAEIYILDVNDDFNTFEDFETCLDNNMRYGSCHFFNTEKKEFKWDDDIDLNRYDCKLEIYRKYFE